MFMQHTQATLSTAQTGESRTRKTGRRALAVPRERR
jgi:hypothetical protein